MAELCTIDRERLAHLYREYCTTQDPGMKAYYARCLLNNGEEINSKQIRDRNTQSIKEEETYPPLI